MIHLWEVDDNRDPSTVTHYQKQEESKTHPPWPITKKEESRNHDPPWPINKKKKKKANPLPSSTVTHPSPTTKPSEQITTTRPKSISKPQTQIHWNICPTQIRILQTHRVIETRPATITDLHRRGHGGDVWERKGLERERERDDTQRMRGEETKRKIWEEEENKVEKETKYKQKKIWISPFFLF